MTGKIYRQNQNQTVLVALRTRKKIFKSVLIAHIVIIGGILLWGCIVEFFKPEKKKVITVSLYTPPSNPGPPALPVYVPPVPQHKPEKVVERIKKNKKTIKKHPAKKVRKIAKKPKKKKWKPARKIKISKDIVYAKPKKTWKPQPRVKPMSKQKLLSFLNQNRIKIRSNTSSSATSQSYENSVGAYLYQLWSTPDKSVLGGQRPEVKILLNIAAGGKLLNARILSASGVAAMDKSVKILLQKIKYLPVPPGGAQKITLILEVTE